MIPSLFRHLQDSRGVLLTGCGGGFDVVSGLPLLHWLHSQAIPVVLGNLSFSHLALACRQRIGPAGWQVDETCVALGYFPERALQTWLREAGRDLPVIGFARTGVRPLAASYAAVLERYGLDTILLVDGGTDSLIRGDESLLGTPEEDALSLVAAQQTGARRYLACLGFGIDQHHGICHHSFLENAAGHLADGSFLGSVSVEAGTAEGRLFLDAVRALNVRHPEHLSIVSNCIADALEGRFGDVHATDRTHGSTLFVNPLMAMYWFFEAGAVAAAMRFAPELAGTDRFDEVVSVIRRAHGRATPRPWTPLPL